jgi:predicted regulator of Ras-like GTPase activity (Roadblock/LC7/MglB family)
VTTTWSLPATDSRTVESALEELILRTQALSAHLVDRSGQLVASVGRRVEYDLTTFASLAAADLAANDELARLIGEPRVDGVACLGSLRSMVSTQVGEGLVLCVVFDRNSSLGIVRHRMRRAAERLWPLFSLLAQRFSPPAAATASGQEFSDRAVEAVDELLGGAE